MVINKIGQGKVGSAFTSKKAKYGLSTTASPGRYRVVAKRKTRVINKKTGKKLICKSDRAFIRVR